MRVIESCVPLDFGPLQNTDDKSGTQVHTASLLQQYLLAGFGV